MTAQRASRRKRGRLRCTSVIVIVCFLSTLYPGEMLAASAKTSSIPLPASMSILPQSLGSLKLPTSLGHIEESFDGGGNDVVFLIQDAHAVTDAQKNIQKLIAFFKENYGIHQVAVEGASAPLDATLFRAFPDDHRLKQVFKDYLARGELTGPTAAAVFNRAPSQLNGVEDWKIFEEGMQDYLLAIDNLPKIEPLIAASKKRLNARKQEIYPPVLLDLDLTLRGFNDGKMELASTLKKLASIREPLQGSGPAVILEEIRHEAVGENGKTAVVRKIANELRRELTSQRSAAALAAGGQAASGKMREFNQKYQEFQTGQIHDQAFALFLKEFLDSQPALADYSERRTMLKELSILSGHQKLLREIQGTRFFAELKEYVAQVKEDLFTSIETRDLDRESEDMDRWDRLAHLKLDHADWNKIQETDIKNLEKSVGHLLKPAFAFYKNAKQRDRILFEGVENQLKRAVKTQVHRPACLLVAGGFHTEGVTQLLRENNISYAVLMPQINSLPDESVYQNQMRGQVSWSSYFKEENGSIDLNAAFIRAARDRLLESNPSASVLDADRYTLKTWRDQIIRELSSQGRITEAAKYTRYLDEVTVSNNAAENEFIRAWRANIHRFVEGLKQLDGQKQLTPDNAARLLTPAALISPFPANAIVGGSRLKVVPIGRQSIPSAKSEVRTLSSDKGERKDGSQTVYTLQAIKALNPVKAFKRLRNNPSSFTYRFTLTSRINHREYPFTVEYSYRNSRSMKIVVRDEMNKSQSAEFTYHPGQNDGDAHELFPRSANLLDASDHGFYSQIMQPLLVSVSRVEGDIGNKDMIEMIPKHGERFGHSELAAIFRTAAARRFADDTAEGFVHFVDNDRSLVSVKVGGEIFAILRRLAAWERLQQESRPLSAEMMRKEQAIFEGQVDQDSSGMSPVLPVAILVDLNSRLERLAANKSDLDKASEFPEDLAIVITRQLERNETLIDRARSETRQIFHAESEGRKQPPLRIKIPVAVQAGLRQSAMAGLWSFMPAALKRVQELSFESSLFTLGLNGIFQPRRAVSGAGRQITNVRSELRSITSTKLVVTVNTVPQFTLSSRMRSLSSLITWLPVEANDVSELTIQDFLKTEPNYDALDKQTLERQIRDSTFDSREDILRFLARTSAWSSQSKEELGSWPRFDQAFNVQMNNLLVRSFAGRKRELKKKSAAALLEVFEKTPAFKNAPVLTELLQEPLLKMISQYRKNIRERFFSSLPESVVEKKKPQGTTSVLSIIHRLGSSEAGRFLFSSPLWGLLGFMLSGVTSAVIFGVLARFVLGAFQGLIDNLGVYLETKNRTEKGNPKLKYEVFEYPRVQIRANSDFEEVRQAFSDKISFALSPREMSHPLMLLILLENLLHPAVGLKNYRLFVRALRLRFLDEPAEGLTKARMAQILNEEIRKTIFSRGDEKIIFVFQTLGIPMASPAVTSTPAKSFLGIIVIPFNALGRVGMRLFRYFLRTLIGAFFNPVRISAAALQMKNAAHFLLKLQNYFLVTLRLEPIKATGTGALHRMEMQRNPFFTPEKRTEMKAELVQFLKNLRIPEMAPLIEFVEDEVTIKFDPFIDKKWYPPYVILRSREGQVKNVLDDTLAEKGESAYDFESRTLRLSAHMPRFMQALVLMKLIALAFQHNVIRTNTGTQQLTPPALIKIQRKILWRLAKSILTRSAAANEDLRNRRLTHSAYFLAASHTMLLGDAYTNSANPSVVVIIQHNLFFRAAIKAKENFTKAFYLLLAPQLIGVTDQEEYPEHILKKNRWTVMSASIFNFVKPLVPVALALTSGLLNISVFLAMFSGLMFNLNLDFLGGWVVGLKDFMASIELFGIGALIRELWAWIAGSYDALRSTLESFLNLFNLDFSILKSALTKIWDSLEPGRTAIQDYAVPFVYSFVIPAVLFVWGLVYGLLINQMRIKLRRFLSSNEGPPAVMGTLTEMIFFMPLWSLSLLTKPFFGSEWFERILEKIRAVAERISVGSRLNGILKRLLTYSFDGLYALLSMGGTLGYGYLILSLASPTVDLAARINALQSSGIALPPMALFYASMIFVGLPFALLAQLMEIFYRYFEKRYPGSSKHVNFALILSLFLITSVGAPLNNLIFTHNPAHFESIHNAKVEYAEDVTVTKSTVHFPDLYTGYKGRAFWSNSPFNFELEVEHAEPLRAPGSHALVIAKTRATLGFRYPGLAGLVDPQTGYILLPSAEELKKLETKAEANNIYEEHGVRILINNKNGREIDRNNRVHFDQWFKPRVETIMEGFKNKNRAVYGNSGFFWDLFSLFDLEHRSTLEDYLSTEDLQLIQEHLLDILEGNVPPEKNSAYDFYNRRLALIAFTKIQAHARSYHWETGGGNSNLAKIHFYQYGINRFMNISESEFGYDLGRVVAETQAEFRKKGISGQALQTHPSPDKSSRDMARSEMRDRTIAARTLRRNLQKSLTKTNEEQRALEITGVFYQDIKKRFPNLDILAILDRFQQLEEGIELKADDPLLLEIFSLKRLIESILRRNHPPGQINFHSLQIFEQLASLTRAQVKAVEEQYNAALPSKTGFRGWIAALLALGIDFLLRGLARYSKKNKERALQQRIHFFEDLDRVGMVELKKAAEGDAREAHGTDTLTNSFGILRSGSIRHSTGKQQTAPLSLIGDANGPHNNGEGLFVRSQNYDERKNRRILSADGTLEAFEVSLDQIELIIFSAQVSELMKQKFPDYADKIKSYGEAAAWLSEQQSAARSEMRMKTQELEVGQMIIWSPPIIGNTPELTITRKGFPQLIIYKSNDGVFFYNEWSADADEAIYHDLKVPAGGIEVDGIRLSFNEQDLHIESLDKSNNVLATLKASGEFLIQDKAALVSPVEPIGLEVAPLPKPATGPVIEYSPFYLLLNKGFKIEVSVQGNIATVNVTGLENKTISRDFELSAVTEIVIGRDPSTQITINGPWISRRNTKIILTKSLSGGYEVKVVDLDSRNGTFDTTGVNRLTEPLVLSKIEPQKVNLIIPKQTDGLIVNYSPFYLLPNKGYTISVSVQGNKGTVIVDGYGLHMRHDFDLSQLSEVILGRHPKTGIAISNFAISRQHARIIFTQDSSGGYAVQVIDGGVGSDGNSSPSRGGTFVGEDGTTEVNNRRGVQLESMLVQGPLIPVGTLAETIAGQRVSLEYDPIRGRILPTTYQMQFTDLGQLPATDSRTAEAEALFDRFEDINNEILTLMGQPGMTLADYDLLEKSMDDILAVFQKLYGSTEPKISESMHFLKESAILLNAFKTWMKSQRAKLKDLKPGDLLPAELVEMIGRSPETVVPRRGEDTQRKPHNYAKELIGKESVGDEELKLIYANYAPATQKGVAGLLGLSLNEILNVIHQKAIRNHDYLIEAYGGAKREVTVKITRSADNKEKTMNVPFADTRSAPNQEIPVAMQHVAMAFAKGQLVHQHGHRFDPRTMAEISANDQRVRIGMNLGVHTSRVLYTFASPNDRGRIVINYQDSVKGTDEKGAPIPYEGSIRRLRLVEELLKAEGFRVAVNEQTLRLSAHFDKVNASSYAMDVLPEKLTFVLQLLSAIKNWDIDVPWLGENFATALANDAIYDRVVRRMQEDGFIGLHWVKNTAESLKPKLSTEVLQQMSDLATIVGTDLGQKPWGQRALDVLTDEIQKEIERGAVTVQPDGSLKQNSAYEKAKKVLPAVSFLKILEGSGQGADASELDEMRRLAVIAKAIEANARPKVVDEIGSYQLVRLTLPLVGDEINFYALRNTESGNFELAYAIYGPILYNHPREDRIWGLDFSTNNQLSVNDLEVLLSSHGMGRAADLTEWLKSVGLQTKYGNKSIFELVNKSPEFVKETVSEFDSDELKYGSKRGIISATSEGGIALNRRKKGVIGQIRLNHPKRTADEFRGMILVTEEADVGDNDKMEQAAAIVTTKGGTLSHAGITARQLNLLGLLLPGVELSETGLHFKETSRLPISTNVPFLDADVSIRGVSDSESVSGRSSQTKDVIAGDGDLVYVDAASGMFYVLASVHDTAAIASFEKFQAWTVSEEKSPKDLESILGTISNINLFRAVLDLLVTSEDVSLDELKLILQPLLKGISERKDEVQKFFERRLRRARGSFLKSLKGFRELVAAANLDKSGVMYGTMLSLARLDEERKNIESFSKILQFDSEGTEQSRKVDDEWQQVVQETLAIQTQFKERVKKNIRSIYANSKQLIDTVEAGNGKDVDPEDLSMLLGSMRRVVENVALAFTEEETKFDADLQSFITLYGNDKSEENEKTVQSARRQQVSQLAEGHRVLTKAQLMDLASIHVGGGKTGNSAQTQTAIVILRDLITEVSTPNGFALLLSAYQSWQHQPVTDKAKLTDELTRREVALAYRDLVINQLGRLISFIDSDSATPILLRNFLSKIVKAGIEQLKTATPSEVGQQVQKLKEDIGKIVNHYVSEAVKIKIQPSPELKARLAVLASVAVRSSGLNEDSKENAQAGKKMTKLNISSLDDIYAAIIAVWEDGAEGILIDDMTNPDIGILAFSVDPSGEPQMRVESALGLTKGLVDKDIGTPHTVLLKKKGQADYKIVGRTPGNQTQKVILNPDLAKGETAFEAIPAAQAKQRVLTDEQEQKIAKTLDLLTQYFGYPLDVEGAFWGDIFIIYQVRPVTTLYASIQRAKNLLSSAQSLARSEMRLSSFSTREDRQKTLRSLKKLVRKQGISFSEWVEEKVSSMREKVEVKAVQQALALNGLQSEQIDMILNKILVVNVPTAILQFVRLEGRSSRTGGLSVPTSQGHKILFPNMRLASLLSDRQNLADLLEEVTEQDLIQQGTDASDAKIIARQTSEKFLGRGLQFGREFDELMKFEIRRRQEVYFPLTMQSRLATLDISAVSLAEEAPRGGKIYKATTGNDDDLLVFTNAYDEVLAVAVHPKIPSQWGYYGVLDFEDGQFYNILPDEFLRSVHKLLKLRLAKVDVGEAIMEDQRSQFGSSQGIENQHAAIFLPLINFYYGMDELRNSFINNGIVRNILRNVPARIIGDFGQTIKLSTDPYLIQAAAVSFGGHTNYSIHSHRTMDSFPLYHIENLVHEIAHERVRILMENNAEGMAELTQHFAADESAAGATVKLSPAYSHLEGPDLANEVIGQLVGKLAAGLSFLSIQDDKRQTHKINITRGDVQILTKYGFLPEEFINFTAEGVARFGESDAIDLDYLASVYPQAILQRERHREHLEFEARVAAQKASQSTPPLSGLRSEVRGQRIKIRGGETITLVLPEDTKTLVSIQLEPSTSKSSLAISRRKGDFSFYESASPADRIQSFGLVLNQERSFYTGFTVWTDGKTIVIKNTRMLTAELFFENAIRSNPPVSAPSYLVDSDKGIPSLSRSALQPGGIPSNILANTRFSKEQSPFAELGGPLTLDFLQHHGFEPAVEVNLPMPELGRTQKVYLAGRVVDLGKGRAFTLGYVEDLEPEGRVPPGEKRYVVRTYYRSNSQGGFWRLLPAVLMNDELKKPSWYDKAFGEDSISVEGPLLKAINRIILLRGIETIANKKTRYLLFAGTGKNLASPWQGIAYKPRGAVDEPMNPVHSLIPAFGEKGRELNVGSEFYRRKGQKTPPTESGYTNLQDKPVFGLGVEEDAEREQKGHQYQLVSNLYTDGVPDIVRITGPDAASPELVTLDTQRNALQPNQKMTTYNNTELTFNGPGIIKRLTQLKREGVRIEYQYESSQSRVPASAIYVDTDGVRHSIFMNSQPEVVKDDSEEEDGGDSWLEFPDGTRQYFNDLGQLIQEVRQNKTYDFSYGLVTVREFDSANKNLRHAFIQDKLGRVMIGASWDLTSPRNAFGLRQSWIDGSSKTTPLYEYDQQADGYGDHSDYNGRYIGMWRNYLSQIPIIQEYLKVFDVKQDPDVFAPLLQQNSDAIVEQIAAPIPHRGPQLERGLLPINRKSPEPAGANLVLNEEIKVGFVSKLLVKVDEVGNVEISSSDGNRYGVSAEEPIRLTLEDLKNNPSFSFGSSNEGNAIVFKAASVAKQHGTLYFEFDKKSNQLSVRLSVKQGNMTYARRMLVIENFSFNSVTLRVPEAAIAEPPQGVKVDGKAEHGPTEAEQAVAALREGDQVVMTDRKGRETAYEVISTTEYPNYLRLQPLDGRLSPSGNRILFPKESLLKLSQSARGLVILSKADYGKLSKSSAEKALGYLMRQRGHDAVRRLLAARLDQLNQSVLLNPRAAQELATLQTRLSDIGADSLLEEGPRSGRASPYLELMQKFVREGEVSESGFSDPNLRGLFIGDEFGYSEGLDFSQPEKRVRILSRTVDAAGEPVSFQVLDFSSLKITTLRASDMGVRGTRLWIRSVYKLTERLLRNGQYPARSELRKREAGIRPESSVQRDTVLKKTVLALRQPGQYFISVSFTPSELSQLLGAVNETRDFDRLESELIVKMDILIQEATETLITNLAESTKNTSSTYTVGLVVPQGLNSTVLDHFLEGYIEGLVGIVREVLLKNLGKNSGVIERMRQSGLSVRLDLNPNRRAPVLAGDDQEGIPVATLDAQSTPMTADYIDFGVDLTPANIKRFENDPERLRMIGYFAAKVQIILAELGKNNGLSPERLKEELHKRLFGSSIGNSDFIQINSSQSFRMNLDVMDQIVNDMIRHKAAAIAA